MGSYAVAARYQNEKFQKYMFGFLKLLDAASSIVMLQYPNTSNIYLVDQILWCHYFQMIGTLHLCPIAVRFCCPADLSAVNNLTNLGHAFFSSRLMSFLYSWVWVKGLNNQRLKISSIWIKSFFRELFYHCRDVNEKALRNFWKNIILSILYFPSFGIRKFTTPIQNTIQAHSKTGLPSRTI